MTQFNVNLPYFEGLLESFHQGNDDLIQAYGYHVHWGYWDDPTTADGSIPDFVLAAENLSHQICDVAGVTDDMRVLEVGCGFGGTLVSLNQRFSNLELVGLNIDDRQLARAKAQIQPQSQNQIEFVCADACKLPFPDESFDVVLAVECIFHFPSRSHFFQEVQRVLRPSGRLALSDFLPSDSILPLIELFNPLLQIFASRIYGPLDLTYTLTRYRTLAQATGLVPSVEADVTTNVLPTFLILRALQRQQAFERQRRLKQLTQINILSEWLFRWNLFRCMILGFQAKK